MYAETPTVRPDGMFKQMDSLKGTARSLTSPDTHVVI